MHRRAGRSTHRGVAPISPGTPSDGLVAAVGAGALLRICLSVARAAAVAALPLLAAPPAVAAPDEPLRLSLNEWTSQRISTQLMGSVLARAGHRVEYVDAAYLDQLDAIAEGRIDVAMEFWSTTGRSALEEAVAAGKVSIIGGTGMVVREEWWYPAYMKERCPGLPDWQALNACAAAFAVPETAPKGRYVGGPVTWVGYDEERVEALGLDFEVVHADSEADLYSTLETAVARRQPVLLWIYAPHWAPVRYEGEWVTFPAFTDACYKERRFDCGKPSGPIWKVGASDLAVRWPEAAQAIAAFRLSNEEMGEMMARVEVDGLSVEAAVAEWMAAHETVWKAWLD